MSEIITLKINNKINTLHSKNPSPRWSDGRRGVYSTILTDTTRYSLRHRHLTFSSDGRKGDTTRYSCQKTPIFDMSISASTLINSLKLIFFNEKGRVTEQGSVSQRYSHFSIYEGPKKAGCEILNIIKFFEILTDTKAFQSLFAKNDGGVTVKLGKLLKSLDNFRVKNDGNCFTTRYALPSSHSPPPLRGGE